MRKVLTAPSIHFKGSGFYKTDYASKKESGGEGKPAEAKSESKSETKSDSSGTKSSE
jgi:predicted nucleic acid-binding Zn ribbon protein